LKTTDCIIFDNLHIIYLKGSVDLKENIINNMKRCIKNNIIGISSGVAIGVGIGTVLGLGINCKITRSISPTKKGAVVALGALGEMMTTIAQNLR